MYISRPMVLENSFCRHDDAYVDPNGPSTHSQKRRIALWCKENKVPFATLLRAAGINKLRNYGDAEIVIAYIDPPPKEVNCVHKIIVV